MPIRHGTVLTRIALVAALSCVVTLSQHRAGIAQTAIATYAPVKPAPLSRDTAERMFALYDAGQYEAFDTLNQSFGSSLVNPFEFEAEAERWLAAAPDRPRRAFVVSTVALELARRQLAPEGGDLSVRRTEADLSFALAELGCQFLREHAPSPMEHAWHVMFVELARSSFSFGLDHIHPREPPVEMSATANTRALVDWERREQAIVNERRKAWEALMKRLRQQLPDGSRTTRINISNPLSDHGKHLLARFPDDPLPALAKAFGQEAEGLQPFNETLLTSGYSSVWIGADAVEQIASGGAGRVNALPRNSRMDQRSAERLLRIVPPRDNFGSSDMFPVGRPRNAAESSLVVLRIVDSFRAVTALKTAPAEAYLRLGQNYVRLAQPVPAIQAFARADVLAVTPYDAYLTRLLAGAVFDRLGRRQEAIAAYRGALQAVPRARSAALVLAPLLLTTDAKEDAAEVLEHAMQLPQPDDPLDDYFLGDSTAVPRAFARFRQELQR